MYPDEKLDGSSLSLASWNVQALFDGVDEGVEYDEYRAASGWNEEKYKSRLTLISDAATGVYENGPDVLALIEVENSLVLDALANDGLKKSKYYYKFFAGHPGYSLGVGVLSRYKITKQAVHSLNNKGRILPRPIAEVWIEAGSKPIALFICHWKSKLGGEEGTEELRREAASVVLRRYREIQSEYPGAPVLVLGDLNENYDEFYRRGAEAVCALMPDDPDAAREAGFLYEEQEEDDASEDAEGGGALKNNSGVVFVKESPKDFLIVSSEKPPRSRYFPYSEAVFYSPWSEELENGSYFYGGWETIDHFLLSPGFWSSGEWNFESAAVLNVEPFVNSKGEPASYNPRSGAGLSDHLPLLLLLKKE